ncbi:MAG: very short patch repair endonuclease [Nanoarchaeota archaeon]
MADKFSKAKRSAIMSRIRSKNTSLEVEFRKLLWKNGLGRYRIHYNLPGKPDIVYVSKKIVIFLDGDFWHGYNWKKLGKVPPRKYWQKKIQKNIDRAKKYNKMLKKDGWKVIRIWEHDVKESPEECISKIINILNF